MALFAGGPTAAVALRGALPFWALALIALVGFGVLSATLLDEASPLATVPVFGAFGLGWVGLGLLVRSGCRPARSRPALVVAQPRGRVKEYTCFARHAGWNLPKNMLCFPFCGQVTAASRARVSKGKVT